MLRRRRQGARHEGRLAVAARGDQKDLLSRQQVAGQPVELGLPRDECALRDDLAVYERIFHCWADGSSRAVGLFVRLENYELRTPNYERSCSRARFARPLYAGSKDPALRLRAVVGSGLQTRALKRPSEARPSTNRSEFVVLSFLAVTINPTARDARVLRITNYAN